ncbi:hypothetical protein PRUPE_2G017600 [Prunus persica]|uniref:Uncharacterized protein n=1 Tax=Prunus persica TaxID=3760 RepID=A0A251QCT8_PRUPE|nr:hypothetical protein PRUPE_2G017600 [Prunus persica]
MEGCTWGDLAVQQASSTIVTYCGAQLVLPPWPSKSKKSCLNKAIVVVIFPVPIGCLLTPLSFGCTGREEEEEEKRKQKLHYQKYNNGKLTLSLNSLTSKVYGGPGAPMRQFFKTAIAVTTVVVSSSNTTKQVLRTHDRFLSLRKICNSHLFAPKILNANQPSRRMKVEELIYDVNESLVKGEAVDIRKATFKTTLNLLSHTMFSMDLVDASSEMAREFKEIVWGSMEEAQKPNWKIEQVFDRIIIQRLESRKAHDYVITNDMLDTFLNISGVNSEDMDMTKLQHLLLILFTAGTDTTSATLEWAMAELLRNPKKLSKAQQELEKIIGKGKPVEEGDIARPGRPSPLTSLIARLPYFQAIIKETFLLDPATPLLLPRKADSNVEICRLYFVNAWAIGRDPNIWDNPSSFVSERFLGLDDQIDVSGKNFELIPFGAGRRICPGLPWTMRILPLMLGSLINSFE